MVSGIVSVFAGVVSTVVGLGALYASWLVFRSDLRRNLGLLLLLSLFGGFLAWQVVIKEWFFGGPFQAFIQFLVSRQRKRENAIHDCELLTSTQKDGWML